MKKEKYNFAQKFIQVLAYLAVTLGLIWLIKIIILGLIK